MAEEMGAMLPLEEVFPFSLGGSSVGQSVLKLEEVSLS